jgi:hypothetical protein
MVIWTIVYKDQDGKEKSHIFNASSIESANNFTNDFINKHHFTLIQLLRENQSIYIRN